MLKLQFLGAAGQVTGSKYYIHSSTSRGVLVDSGLFQGGRELRGMNWTELPIQPGNIGNILITHAHLDHIGYLPRLVKGGYKNPIFATEATIEIAGYVLRDSAHLQEEGADHANKHHYSKHQPALPLYTEEDAEGVLKLFQRIDRYKKKILPDNISAVYSNAGHILGSCSILIEKRYDDRDPISILFSGDIGRRAPIYLKPKDPAPAADYIVCESTYGDRLHKDIPPLDELKAVVNDTVQSKSVLLIPAFAVDRTQELMFCLNALMRDGAVPDSLPVYVDSPMANGVTDIYDKFCDEHTFTQAELNEPDKNPLRFKSLKIITTPEDSKHLNSISGPAVIISASGMATGGRIMHHLANRLSNTDTIVLFTGYQAEETLGRELIEGAKQVRIFGESVEVKARITKLNSFSGHADQGEILDWLKSAPKPPKMVFLTHGEDDARTVLKAKIESDLGWKVMMPKLGEIVDLETI
ncbi:MAG TPA: MBL fold metallo-hydrolase [Candidatus Kapabacteria bacterium]|nr:MBL fold metallo-hydrolase [Candidatus Kapabacteria bacterium]